MSLLALFTSVVALATAPTPPLSPVCGESRIVHLSPESERIAQAYFDDVIDRVRFGREQSNLHPIHVIIESSRPCTALVIDREFGFIYWNAHYLLRHPFADTDYFVAGHELAHFGLLNRGLGSRLAREYHADLQGIARNVFRRGTFDPALAHPETLIDFLSPRVRTPFYPNGNVLATIVKWLVATDETSRVIPSAPTVRPGMDAVIAELATRVGPRVVDGGPRGQGLEQNVAAVLHARVTDDELGALRALDHRRRHAEGTRTPRENLELGIEYVSTMRMLLARIERERGTPALARTLQRFAALTDRDGAPAYHFFEYWSHFLDDLGEDLGVVMGMSPEDLAREFAWKFELPKELVGPDSKLAEEIARNLLLSGQRLDVSAPVTTLALGRLMVGALREKPNFGDRPLASAILALYENAANTHAGAKTSALVREFRKVFRRTSRGLDRAWKAFREIEAEHPHNADLAANIARLRFTLDVGMTLASGSSLPPAPVRLGDEPRKFALDRASLKGLIDDVHVWQDVFASEEIPRDLVLALVAYLRGDEALPPELERELEIRLLKNGVKIEATELARTLQNWFFELSTFERTLILQLVIDGASRRLNTDARFREALFKMILDGLPDASARRAFLERWTARLDATPPLLHATLLATALTETSPAQRLERPAFVTRAEAWDLANTAWGDLRARGLRLKHVISSTNEHVWMRFVDLKTGEEITKHVARTKNGVVSQFAAELKAEVRPRVNRFGIFGMVYFGVKDWWQTRRKGVRAMSEAFKPFEPTNCEAELTK